MIARNVHVVTPANPLALVTIPEAREHLRLDACDLDQTLAGLIRTAYATVEAQTNRTLLAATLETTFDRFPRCGDRPGLELPRSPLLSVTVTYTDPAGDAQTLDAAEYAVRDRVLPPRVDLRSGRSWPATIGEAASVVVRYVSGYGTAAASVPPQAKHAVLLLVDHWFAMHGPVVVGGGVSEVPKTVDYLLAQIAAPEVV